MQLINITVLLLFVAGIVHAGPSHKPSRPPLDPSLSPTARRPKRFINLRAPTKLLERDGPEATVLAPAAA
jgi:hypothetical protein